MINIVTSPAWNGYALRSFMAEFAPELPQHVKFIDWADLMRWADGETHWPGAKVWLFFAIDAHCRRHLLRIEQAIRLTGGHIWNAPSRRLGRVELLRALQLAGINTYRVHDLDDRQEWRWPVFIRARGEQVGLPLFLADAAAARRELFSSPSHYDVNNVAVEYVDTRGPDGLFRKYSIMRIGERYIPRHVLFSREWFLKTPDVVSDDLVHEELTFVVEAEVPPVVVEAFNIAGIEYGRIDYGIDADNRIQVWEINHSPVVYPMPLIHATRQPSQWHSAQAIRAALKEYV